LNHTVGKIDCSLKYSFENDVLTIKAYDFNYNNNIMLNIFWEESTMYAYSVMTKWVSIEK